jgi:hypothetical protein
MDSASATFAGSSSLHMLITSNPAPQAPDRSFRTAIPCHNFED